MSLNVLPLEVVQTVDPILNLHHKRVYNAFDGGQDITYTRFDSQSSNNSNITIVCNPPSETTVISPIIWHRYKILYEGRATSTGANQKVFNFGLYDAPRAFPIASISTTCQLKANGTAFMTNLNQYFHATTRYAQNYEQQEHLFSMTPSMLDANLYYSDGIGGVRDPISKYQDNSVQVPRGGYVEISNVVNPVSAGAAENLVATFEAQYTEPIFVSPFFFSQSGFAGIKTMTYNNIMSDLTRSWFRYGPDTGSGNAAPAGLLTLTSFTANIATNGGVSLFFRYITPKLLDRIPKQLVYPYNELLVTISSQSGSIAAGASAVMNMNALNLESIPRRLYVYAREQDNDIQGFANLWKTDTYAQIENININWANKAGVLSSAQQQDLYQICRRNGCNLSYSQWLVYTGGVMAIDCGKEIGLSSLEAPGLLSNPQLSMKVTLKNITNLNPLIGGAVRAGRTINYSLYVIVVYEGTTSIVNGNIIKQVACLNSTDIVNAQANQEGEFVAHDPTNYFGGSVIDALKMIRSGIQHGAPVLKKIADVAENVGLAIHNGSAIGGKIGGMKHKKGGRMIQRSQLSE